MSGLVEIFENPKMGFLVTWLIGYSSSHFGCGQPHYSWAAPRGSLSLLSTHSFTIELTTALLETVDKCRKNVFMSKSLRRMYRALGLELNVTCLPHSPNRYMAPVVNYLIKPISKLKLCSPIKRFTSIHESTD